MTFLELKYEVKEEQKLLAQKIKEFKEMRKDSPDGYVDGLWYHQNDYRHTHIMYCHFFNNTPYDSIEQPRDGNSPDSRRLENLRTEWESKIDEALRDCA